jgi:hypothetical protein
MNFMDPMYSVPDIDKLSHETQTLPESRRAGAEDLLRRAKSVRDGAAFTRRNNPLPFGADRLAIQQWIDLQSPARDHLELISMAFGHNLGPHPHPLLGDADRLRNGR